MKFTLAIFTELAATFLGSTMATAAEEPSEQVKRMDAAATVLDEIMGTPDKGIPEELREVRCGHTLDDQNRFCLRGPTRQRTRHLPHQFRMERSSAFLCHWGQLGIADRRRSDRRGHAGNECL